MPDAFNWPLIVSNNADESGISVVFLVEKCATVTDITDATEVAALKTANNLYTFCVLNGEQPKPETQSFSESSANGSKDVDTKNQWTVTWEAYVDETLYNQLGNINGKPDYRIGTINATSASKRILRFWDVKVDNLRVLPEQSGNSEDNKIMVMGESIFTLPVDNLGEYHDVTSDTALLAEFDCNDDC